MRPPDKSSLTAQEYAKSLKAYFQQMTKRNSKLPHRATAEAEYTSWHNMIARCYKITDLGYKNYGGRGIGVCKRWRNSFENYYEDMGDRPTPKHTLERRDNDKEYSKENCRWATRKEQARNRRSNVNLTFNGRTMCVKDWAVELGVAAHRIRYRLRIGKTVEEALTFSNST